MREIASFGLPAGLAGSAQVSYGNIDFLVAGADARPRPTSASTTARTRSACSTRTRSARSSRGWSTPSTRAPRTWGTCVSCAPGSMRVNATVIFPLLALFIAVAPERGAVALRRAVGAGRGARADPHDRRHGADDQQRDAGRHARGGQAARLLLYFNLYRRHRARPDGPRRVAVGPATPSASPSPPSRSSRSSARTASCSAGWSASRCASCSLDTAPAVVGQRGACSRWRIPLTRRLAAAAELPVLLLVAVVGVACAAGVLVVLRLASRPAWDDMLLIVRRILVPARCAQGASTARRPRAVAGPDLAISQEVVPCAYSSPATTATSARCSSRSRSGPATRSSGSTRTCSPHACSAPSPPRSSRSARTSATSRSRTSRASTPSCTSPRSATTRSGT